MQIGIIGNGHVGSAVAHAFRPHYPLFIYDTNPDLTKHTLEEVVENCDYIFMCLPTPMNALDGSCDASYVERSLQEISSIANTSKPTILLKSTVAPSISAVLAEMTGLGVCFHPEFLTEKNATEDYLNQERAIFGHTSFDSKTILDIDEIFAKVLPDSIIFHTDSTTAEMVKYMTNAFLATKVAFANEMSLLCEALSISYSDVKELFVLDSRIADTHLEFPGHDGLFGFGGSCLPKDLNGLLHLLEITGLPDNVVKGAWLTNQKVRDDV